MRSTITHLEEANLLAEAPGLPGERWQILAKLGELYQAAGEETKAQVIQVQATEIRQAITFKY